MTFQQIQLVKDSYQRVAALPADAVGQLFYGRLFGIAPEVRPLFIRTSVPEQSKKLLATFTYVITRLDQLDTVVADVEALARRHMHYGVQEHHYVVVGQALLWTLEQGLGSAWTPEVQAAWQACYTLLSDTMLNAVVDHKTNDDGKVAKSSPAVMLT
ncbi:globin family protein [Fibrella aquatilis]|uniref:Hemoglobin n=1 Tax=Fibrella aquatilis TaxID=2817059 RepID=A0A939G614_9BACT|nr:globin family protein [Fibrella aquatilis]MBO0930857.1 hemoglobin [Fibrella aquatilis]